MPVISVRCATNGVRGAGDGGGACSFLMVIMSACGLLVFVMMGAWCNGGLCRDCCRGMRSFTVPNNAVSERPFLQANGRDLPMIAMGSAADRVSGAGDCWGLSGRRMLVMMA